MSAPVGMDPLMRATFVADALGVKNPFYIWGLRAYRRVKTLLTLPQSRRQWRARQRELELRKARIQACVESRPTQAGLGERFNRVL
ncbi:MAG: hypothetical protein IPK79_06375 [Vampirovibrionales bacterium]|nr:hypothetical protein [Vampirovibrionales bacterium]